MGAPDSKGFRGFIPRDEVGEAATWEFASLSGDVAARGAPAQLTERERRVFERGRAQGQTEGQLAERRVKAEHGTKVAALTADQVRQIAQTKLPDLNANDIDAAARIIEGTARSMGVTVE